MLVSSSLAVHDKDTVISREANFPHWTCAYLRIGEIDLRANRQRLLIGSPSFVLIPPNHPYSFSVTVPDEHVWAIFDGTPQLANSLDHLRDGVHTALLDFENEIDKAIASAMENVLFWWRSEPIRLALAENSLERALLLYSELEHPSEYSGDSRIGDILNFIADNLRSDLSVPDLAKRVYLSSSRFAALFRQETGTTPARYIESKRLETACDLLLNSNFSITIIAAEVGYKNAFHFSTRFSAVYGQSPREYRKQPIRHRHEIEPQLPS